SSGCFRPGDATAVGIARISFSSRACPARADPAGVHVVSLVPTHVLGPRRPDGTPIERTHTCRTRLLERHQPARSKDLRTSSSSARAFPGAVSRRSSKTRGRRLHAHAPSRARSEERRVGEGCAYG